MVHTNYDFIGGAIEGQYATTINTNIRSLLNQSGVVVAFGRAVVWDDTNDQLELPDAAGEKFLGVSVRTVIYEDALDAGGFAGFPNGREMDYMTSGDVFVFVETDVKPNDPVFFRHTANGAGKDVIGRFRTDADTATCDEITTIANWAGEYSAGDLAKLTLNVG